MTEKEGRARIMEYAKLSIGLSCTTLSSVDKQEQQIRAKMAATIMFLLCIKKY